VNSRARSRTAHESRRGAHRDTSSATIACERVSGRAHVLDGNTIEIAGARVRLHPINAPELTQRCSYVDVNTRCGEIARDALREPAEGREAVCEGRDRDRSRRLVTVCRIAGLDLCRARVARGRPSQYPYSLGYVTGDHQARAAQRGAVRDARRSGARSIADEEQRNHHGSQSLPRSKNT
jgi:endonuclease YncB( thermonuclease family)